MISYLKCFYYGGIIGFVLLSLELYYCTVYYKLQFIINRNSELLPKLKIRWQILLLPKSFPDLARIGMKSYIVSSPCGF